MCGHVTAPSHVTVHHMIVYCCCLSLPARGYVELGIVRLGDVVDTGGDGADKAFPPTSFSSLWEYADIVLITTM